MATEKARQAAEVYTKGTQAWLPVDTDACWISVTCLSNTIADDKVRLVFEDDDETVSCHGKKHGAHILTCCVGTCL